MTSNEKIVIIPDTNMFTPGDNTRYDLTKLHFEKYEDVLNLLELNFLEKNVEIYFPEIVLLELLSKQERQMKKRLTKLNELFSDFNNFEDVSMKIFDKTFIDSYCKSLKEKYYSELKIIPIPNNKTKLFNDILKMAINKYPPFSEKSDPGFKDAILYLSILEFSEENCFDKYILFTRDGVFKRKKETFKKRFKNHAQNSTLDIKHCEISTFITSEFEIYPDLTEYIWNKLFYEITDNYIRNGRISLSYEDFPIEFVYVNTEYTHIKQLKKDCFELTLNLSVELNCQEDGFLKPFYEGVDNKLITQIETYLIEKVNGKWMHTLKKYRYDIDYDLFELDESYLYDEYA